MAIKRWKVNVNDRVWYKGYRATVLDVRSRGLQIRDAYGFVSWVPKKECKPWNE